MTPLDKAVKEKWDNNLVVVKEIIGSYDGCGYDDDRLGEILTSPADCPYCLKHRHSDGVEYVVGEGITQRRFICGTDCPIYKNTLQKGCVGTPVDAIEKLFETIDDKVCFCYPIKKELEDLKNEIAKMIKFLETVYE